MFENLPHVSKDSFITMRKKTERLEDSYIGGFQGLGSNSIVSFLEKFNYRNNNISLIMMVNTMLDRTFVTRQKARYTLPSKDVQ
jgi:hypothetical protein